ncbi:hypothetical protein JCM17724A_19210 [Prevotella fusca JCM 17724]
MGFLRNDYLAAGADIISTNTFSAQRISQGDYHMENFSRDIAFEGARIARECADEFSTTDKPRFVAGSIGPTNKTCSMSPDVSDPAKRDLTYDSLFAAYSEQVAAMIEGGIDAVLIETIFDTLNAKVAIDASLSEMQKAGVDLPVMLSVTITDLSGRTTQWADTRCLSCLSFFLSNLFCWLELFVRCRTNAPLS